MSLLEAPHAPIDHLGQALDLSRAGEITAALRLLDGRSKASDPDDPAATARRCRLLIDVHLARGDLSAARRAGEPLLGSAGAPGLTGAESHLGLGLLTSAEGADEHALTHFRLTGDRHSSGEMQVAARTGAALSLVRLGRYQSAEATATEAVELARSLGVHYDVAQACRTRAAADFSGERVQWLRDAQAALVGVPAKRLAAQVDADLAAMLLLEHTETGRREALGLLAAARGHAHVEGLRPLAARIDRLIERAGVSTLAASAAVQSLTKTELRVATLAAEGLSNRQVADHLVVTVKAVEWHLSNVYRKLAIRSRKSLAPTLGLALRA